MLECTSGFRIGFGSEELFLSVYQGLRTSRGGMFRQALGFIALTLVASTAHSAHSVRVEGADEWRVQAAKVRYAIRQVLNSEGLDLVESQSLRASPTPLDLAGRRALEEASKAIDTLMLDEAAQVLENVLNEVSARPAQLRDSSWYAEAYQTLGIVYGLRGERDRARSVWTTSKRLAPKLLPNPALFNPEMRALYDAIEVGTQFGALRVTSTPAGLDVYIDGTPRGVTPFRADRVPVGEVTLRVQGVGGQASGQRVLVLPGRERAVDFPNGPALDGLDTPAAECGAGLSAVWAARIEVVADRMEIQVSSQDCSGASKDLSFRVVTGLEVDEASLVRELRLEYKAQSEPELGGAAFANSSRGACGGISCERYKNIVAWSTLGTSLALGAGGGFLWWLAAEDEKAFQSQSYPRDLSESLAIADRGKLRALIGDVMLGAAGVGVVSAVSLWLFWEPGMSVSDGPQVALVPYQDGWMLGLQGEF